MLSNCVFGEDSSMVAQRVTYNAGPQRDLGLIPGSGRSPGDGNGNPLQYSFLKKSHGRRSLVGYSPWCHKEPHTTEQIHFHFLESPLDCKDIKPVNPKGNQSWIFIGRTDAGQNSNTLATWCKELTHWKRPWCWEELKEEKGMTEDEMVGLHQWLNGHKLEQTPGDDQRQGSLACSSP